LRISLVTKIFSVFFAITSIDLTLIYVFMGTTHIDEVGRNGLLVAENTALKIIPILGAGVYSDPARDVEFTKKLAALELTNCSTVASDGRRLGGAGELNARALKALKLNEADGRLFFADLSLSGYSADLFIPFKPSADVSYRVLACTVPLKSIRTSLMRILRISAIILVITLVLQFGLAYFIYFAFIKRIRRLERASRLMGEGDFSASYVVGARSDEIDELGNAFNEMRLALAQKTETLENTLVNLEKLNFHLEGDLITGEEIQRSILPETSSGRIKWLAEFHPMSRVSGDLYDIYDLSGGATGILLFDASGHGVPAALLTMMAKVSFVEAIQKVVHPHRVVAAVNDELSPHLQKTGNFLTAFYGVARPDGRFIYCNAAHTQAIYLQKNQAPRLLDPTSLSIGFAPPGGDLFKPSEILVRPGDRLILYTDGVTESRTRSGGALDTEGLIALCEKFRDLEFDQMHNGIITAWKQEIDQTLVEDDVTILSIEFT